MIDKEKVVKGVECHRKKVQTTNAVSCLECPYAEPKPIREWCMSGLMDDIYALLKEQEQRDGWISVKDRLPNCNGCYLVWRPWFYPSKGMPSICYFDGSNTWHDSYGVDFTRTLSENDVTYWMPLPEPPKEDEQDA